MVLEAIDEAVHRGARRHMACRVLGISRSSEQRWRSAGGGVDGRRYTKAPAHALSAEERERVIATANGPAFRDLSPKQIVPRLADQGVYLASESSFYRVLRGAGQMTHRGRSRPPRYRRPREHVATGPCQVWSWDITYLRSAQRGSFYYLYLVEDVWSRMIVGWAVHDLESMELSSQLIAETCRAHGVAEGSLVLHSDNGGPMKGSTMLATLQRLGIVPSFSRPRVSDDNAYCESLFKTLKYRPSYPRRPFASLEEARAWVADFVSWYNTEHLHSGIEYVTPRDRHEGRDKAICAARQKVYKEARERHPARWSRRTRSWEPAGQVVLNPRIAARNQTTRTNSIEADKKSMTGQTEKQN